jgi:hypothetical protein
VADGQPGVLASENSLAELEASSIASQRDREHERGHDDGLGRQHEPPGGHGGEARPDHPGRVLSGDRSRGERPEHHRGDHDPAQRGAGQIPLLEPVSWPAW